MRKGTAPNTMLKEMKMNPLRMKEMGHLTSRLLSERVTISKRGFTLLEVLFAVAVILILSSVSIFVYKRGIAHAREAVCTGNLKVLESAINIYATENYALPASLGHLKPHHLEKGYAKAKEDRDWLERFCYFLVELDSSNHAHAQFLTYENLKCCGVTEENLRCREDHNGGASYGINGNLAGKSWGDIGEDEIIVAESDSYVFYTTDELSKRHGGKGYAAKKNGEIVTLTDDDVNDDIGSGDDNKAEDNLPTNLNASVKFFDDLVNNNLDTPIADKAEDVRNKLITAQNELSKSPPDIKAAQGNIEGAEGDIQAMINDGLIDPADGVDLINLFGSIRSQL